LEKSAIKNAVKVEMKAKIGMKSHTVL